MKKDDFYNIAHIDVRTLLQQELSPPLPGKVYQVYWWDEIPLGHRWIAHPGPKTGYLQQVWETIKDTIRFYDTLSPHIHFNALEAAWEGKEYGHCLELFGRLFDAYALDRPGGMDDISLVICTRNRPEHIKNCLDSLYLLSTAPREVLVVDNAPDDQSTREVVSHYPFVKYVLESEKGLDRARNTGWRAASGAIVAYTDDDVRLHKDWMWQLQQAFNHPRVMGVTGLVFASELASSAQIVFEKYWSFNRGYQDIYYDSDYFRKHLKKGVPVWQVGAGANMAFRRTALETMGDFDIRLDVGASGCNGDSEMWYRLLAGGWTVHYTPRAITYHTHRKDLGALKRQIYYYLRGNTSSLLIQYQRHRHIGNLRHLFRTLPIYYVQSLLRRMRYLHTAKYNTLPQEIMGSISGIGYFLSHHQLPVENNGIPAHYSPQAGHSVSVIITTYNHGKYIAEAIHSVQQQTHRPLEIIVVDDGSTDNTRQVVSQFSLIVYLYQANKGLAAARNVGALHSRGDYVVFLDADDLLYPQALATNLRYFSHYPACAFISGWHDRVSAQKKLLETYENTMPQKDHYLALLRGNYIGMHGAVMYRREVFNTFLFDETLPACEDYDLYLRITKKYPVYSHNEKLAAYRMHAGNLSGDIPLMWKHVKAVLKKNADLHDRQVKKNYQEGIHNWTAYYGRELYRRIAYPYLYPGYQRRGKDGIFVAVRMPRQITLLLLQKLAHMFRKKPKNNPAPGKVNFGDLRRTVPLSKEFGYDRGGPVDRYYIERFLEENAAYIHGKVLEVGDNAYTMKYGAARVTQSDILFIDHSNPQATLIGDLSAADHIAADQFDCIVLTQTLHLIYDFHSAIRHCHRILKPGGTLLVTVPGITQIDYGQWGNTWYWSFTGQAIGRLLSEYFAAEDLFVQSFGNVLAATAFLYGLGQQEVSPQEKNQTDPHYPVTITARAKKKSPGLPE